MTDHLLRQALEQGYISEEYLHKLLMENPDNQMMGVIDTIHTLFCAKEHRYQAEDLSVRGPNDDNHYCYYYPENTLLNPWGQPDRKRWAGRTIRILSNLGLNLPDEMSRFTKELLKVGETNTKFLDRYPAARGMVKEICDLARP